MTEENYFVKALQIADPSERAAFLDRACAGDPDLRGRLDRLLARHAQAGSFLGNPGPLPPTGPPDAPLNDPTDTRPTARPDGGVIGPYKLVEVIGEGGMGTVWLAQQVEPIKRLVALKVIKAGMDTRQVVARFEAERQALALMDHPNISKVLDGGATHDGRPYFVMELVKGVPITEFCDERRLTPRERLELFIPVCQAVQHAHQKGVIHRDIKPSNVLVALYDGRPVPKVIDFGVAKATGQSLTEMTLVTGLGAVVGTPEYMSPEQAELNQLDIDTRSDVYSLGILLYELLTGTTPLERKRVKEAALLEVLRLVREEEPPRPSTRLSTTDELPSIAANRGVEPRKLSGLVRGELDWIVMKALEKDRNRRYETANGFAMDVQRYLADEAVQACPPSANYRLRKFARRNRGRLAAVAVLGLLIVVAALFAWSADRQTTRRQFEVAEQDRTEKARLSRNAEAVSALLEQCEEALRGDLADRAALALGAAERRAAEGGADNLAGRLDRCRRDLKLLQKLDAIDTFNWTWQGDRAPDNKAVVAQWRTALADHGMTPEEGRAEEAAGRVNASLVRDRILTALDLWLADSTSAEVRAVLQSADPDSFRDAFRNAMAARAGRSMAELAGRPEALAQPPRFAAVIGLLAAVPMDRKRAALESALRTRPGSLNLLMALGRLYPKDRPDGVSERVRWYQAAASTHPNNAAAINNLGIALLDQGNPDGAYSAFQEAAKLEPNSVIPHINLGNALLAKRDLDGAIAKFHQAVQIDPKSDMTHYILGNALRAKGDADGAVAAYRQAIQINGEFADAYINLGAVLVDAKRDYPGAITSLRAAIQLAPKTAMAHFNLGNALQANKDTDGAIVAFRQAIQINGKYVAAHINLGNALYSKENLDGAAACYREAIRLAPTSAKAHYCLGNVLWQKGDANGAIASFQEAVRYGPNDASAHLALGALLCDERRDYDGAIVCFKEAIRLNPTNASAHFNLGNALWNKGRLVDALNEYREAIRLDPTDSEFSAVVARLLATGPDGVRDGKKAVEHATRACELTGWKNPSQIETLAAAHAEAGDFNKALEYQRKALDNPTYAKAKGKAARERLDLYARKKPYRDATLVLREVAPPPRAVKQ